MEVIHTSRDGMPSIKILKWLSTDRRKRTDGHFNVLRILKTSKSRAAQSRASPKLSPKGASLLSQDLDLAGIPETEVQSIWHQIEFTITSGFARFPISPLLTAHVVWKSYCPFALSVRPRNDS